MENYKKGEVKEVEDAPIFAHDQSGVDMKVTAGSKIRNLMGYALKRMKEPEIRKISWSGSGNAVTKTVSCAEIMKRKVKGVHQLTQIRYKRVEEYWEPEVEGLERLKVNRDVPAISILLSKDPLDKTQPGYQPPGPFDAFWMDLVQKDRAPKGRLRHQGGGDPQQGQAGKKDGRNAGKIRGREQEQTKHSQEKSQTGSNGTEQFNPSKRRKQTKSRNQSGKSGTSSSANTER